MATREVPKSAPADAFRTALADRLTPLGFEARAQNKSMVRKRGKNVHRVTLGATVLRPALLYEDAETRKLVKGWCAGGPLWAGDFGAGPPGGASGGGGFVERVVAHLWFFDLLDDPQAVLREVSHRYVPGFLAPRMVIPFLRARLGPEAVSAYASALLAGRPELAPAYATELAEGDADNRGEGDHGTQLARALRSYGSGDLPRVPPATVRSRLSTARHCAATSAVNSARGVKPRSRTCWHASAMSPSKPRTKNRRRSALWSSTVRRLRGFSFEWRPTWSGRRDAMSPTHGSFSITR